MFIQKLFHYLNQLILLKMITQTNSDQPAHIALLIVTFILHKCKRVGMGKLHVCYTNCATDQHPFRIE